METALIKSPLGEQVAGPGSPNILIPSIPREYRITGSMIDAWIRNPVEGAEILLGERLDQFQQNRLIKCWCTPRVIDSSGLGCGKSKNLWIVSVLRCILIPDHWVLVYYQTFASGQRNYWNYFSEVGTRSRLFATQVGRIDCEGNKDGKATNKGPSCYTCYFKNQSKIEMPAGGFDRDATSQAGINTNDLCIDEYTKIDGTGSSGIDDQLIGRARRYCFNQNHPFWCNHHLFTATAEDTMHPAYDRMTKYKRRIDAGDPEYQLFNYSVKEFSDLPYDSQRSFKQMFNDGRMLRDLRQGKTVPAYLQEAFGIWSANGRGFYTLDRINRCYAVGRERNAQVLCGSDDEPCRKDLRRMQNIFYFAGIDPAYAEDKKADDGAIVVGRAESRTPKPTSNLDDWWFDFCWAYKVRKADAPQWSGLLHRKQENFGFSLMEMDSQGGGAWIRPALGKEKQRIQNKDVIVRPIATQEDERIMSLNALFILSMFRKDDFHINRLWQGMEIQHPGNLYDRAHTEFLTAIQNGIIGFPTRAILRPPGEMEDWSDERKHANLMLDLTANQLMKICVKTNPDGSTYRNGYGAREFSARGKKDMAYAALYCFTAFIAWLKIWDDGDGLKEEDRAGASGRQQPGPAMARGRGFTPAGMFTEV